jgi:hypothetical protein
MEGKSGDFKMSQKFYITPKGNKYDSLLIEEILKKDLINSELILPEDKEFFQLVYNTYWQSPSHTRQ